MPQGTMHPPLEGEILDLHGGAGRLSDRGLRDDAELVRYETPDDSVPASAAGVDKATVRRAGLAGTQAGSDGLTVLRSAPLPVDEIGSREPLAGRILKVTGFIVAGAAFWINGGHALFTGGADGPLVIASLDSRMEAQDGQTVLRVDTRIENRGASPANLPALLVSVHALDGSSKQYKLGTSRQGLAPGGSHLFSGRVAAPRMGVERVSVRLARSGDG
ncbi:hypothetical protein ACLB6G_05230 [Zhengella sp. ZM62]|uniref:hypothetical protein n=1 Tax=Zhengella sedimenti TaxID=3390035 RepID=UPI003974D100